MEKTRQLLLLAFAILLTILALGTSINVYTKHEVSKATSALTTKYKLESEQEKRKTDKAAADLQNEINKLKGVKDAEIKTLNSRVASLNDRLRKERYNRGDVPDAASQAGTACTGMSLFRQDGEFLIGEAARAEQVLIERDFYYNAYEKARIKIEGLNGNSK